MGDQEKRQRTAAKGRFTRSLNLFNNEIKATEIDIDELELSFNDLDVAWKNVEEKHDEYVATLDEEDPENDNWIIQVQTLYKGARKVYLSTKNKTSNDKVVKEQCRLREVEYNDLVKLCENAKSSMNNNVSKEYIEKERESMKWQFDKLKEVHANYSIMSSEKDDTINRDWINKVAETLNNINSAIDKYVINCDEAKSRKNIRLQKIPLPKFEGNVRNYPRFKRDFINLVQPTLSTNESAFGLRQCLSENVEAYLGSCDDNVEEMFKILDKKFGDPCKITDAVVSEIKNFKTISSDQRQLLVKFVNCIEKGFIDLKHIDMEKEISNANVVSIIEKKRPHNIAERWYRNMCEEKSTIDRKNKFPALLSFLKIERDAVEYGMSEIRNNAVKTSETFNLADGSVTEEPSTKCLVHNASDHTITECNTFKRKSLSEKYAVLRKNRACFCCLKPGHGVENCTNKTVCSEECNQFHHKLLHPEVSGHNSYIDPDENHHRSCLLLIQRIKVGESNGKFANVFWDGGSSISLITESMAEKIGLVGSPVKLNVTTVRGIEQSIDSHRYNFVILDKLGRKYKMVAYGIDHITNEISDIKIDGMIHLFNDISKAEIERPSGKVDILIGMEYAAWHPVKEQSYEHLVIYKNAFGRCLGGHHSSIVEKTYKNTNIAGNVNFISSTCTLQKFFDIESLGTECSPRCGSCRCGKCPIGGKEYTIKEERELALIEQNLKFCGDHWLTTYPWLKNPNELPNNYEQIRKCLVQMEKRLRKDPMSARLYCDQIDDMINRGVGRKLTKQEIESYDGPVHYIAHHGVQKKSSKSTPLRIVFNSSKVFQGRSLNDYWAKGPDNFINNLLGCLIRFRENFIGFIGDIKKMYNSIHIETLDQHCHRFLWRGLDESIEPEIYVITVVNFGDVPSGTMATVALYKTAEREKENYPEAAKIVLESAYRDDIIDSADDFETVIQLTDDINAMLKTGNFHMKEWIYSFKENKEKKEAETVDVTLIEDEQSEKVLGMNWVIESDMFKFEVSDKIVEMFNKPEEEISLSKRKVLSIINGLYDPMGLVVPFTVTGKILMRKLWTTFPDMGWDDQIDGKLKKEWINYFMDMVKLSKVVFPRCSKPKGSVGNPELILFSDASTEAYGACCYLRWNQSDGRYLSRLLLAKSRVAPLKIQSIVRLELCAAVLSKRLRCFVEKYYRIPFKKVIHLLDSQIVQCMLQKESYGFNTFVATRVGEIQESTDPKEWYWINGKDNIADITSRGMTPENLDINSEWQNGPEFLREPIDQWPISNRSAIESIPERNNVIMTVSKQICDSVIDVDRYSKYFLLMKVTARILSLKRKEPRYSLTNIADSPNAEHMAKAKHFWVKTVQGTIKNTLDDAISGKGKLRKLTPRLNECGIYVVGGRAQRWIETSYNKQEVPILSSSHRFTKLLAEYIHRRGHLGTESNIAKIRSEYWVIGLRRLCASIRHNCVDCRKKEGLPSSQVMAKLPLERLKPAPAWSYINVDLFGPFSVRGDINKRSTGKVYGVVFTCLLIRAIYLDIATDYSTDGFLMVFRRFVSLRGYPVKIYSDSGSQLVGMSNELKEISSKWDWDKILDFGANEGVEWIFSPGDAPWWNGCAESLIKSVKKGIHHAIGMQRISFSEMLTVMFEVANLVNERPVGTKPNSDTDFTYLCPNDLILGRSSSRIPSGPWNETTNIKKRFYFIQSIISSYWKKWTQCYFPSLILQQKWHHQTRNMEVGDIVMIQDKNLVRGQWKLGRISVVYPDRDGIVRKVDLQYKNINSNIFTTISRPVKRLIVIMPVNEKTN